MFVVYAAASPHLNRSCDYMPVASVPAPFAPFFVMLVLPVQVGTQFVRIHACCVVVAIVALEI